MLTALYLLAVVGVTGAITGQWLPRTDPQQPSGRGWFPGGEEDEPEPAPQPEQAVRVPSWARP